MDAELDLLRVGNDSGDDLLDKLRGGEAHGVGERDAGNTGVGEQVAGGDDFVDAPRVAVGVAECHGDVSNDVEAGLVGERAYGFEGIDGFFRCLALIALKEAGRDGVREAKRVDAAAVDGAFHALGVDDDADDFKLVVREGRQVGERERLLGVGHLRNSFRGDEGDSVDLPEAGGDEGAKVFGLDFAGDGERQTLPGVAWALDDFDRVVHERAEVDRRGYQRSGRPGD